MDEFLRCVAPLLASQHALITLQQVREHGGDRQRAARYIDRGIWQPVDVGLYGPAGVSMSWRRSLMATQLVAPPGSRISHRAGAALLDVGGLHEPTPEISIPADSRLRRPDVIVHRSSDLHLCEPCVVDGISVTGPERLAMDLGSVVSEQRYRQSMREIRYVHGVSADELLRTYLRHKRQGRNGGGALRDWLDRYYDVNGVPESGLELVALDTIIDAGLPAPQVQWWVRIGAHRYRLDLAYPALSVAIEVDGAQHEDDPDVVCSDRRRLSRLRQAGWTVIVIRSSHLASDLQQALRTLRRLLMDFRTI